MAKRIVEQYDEIFKYVGAKFGLDKFKYQDYLKLKAKNPDDTRIKHFDEFIDNNLPIEKSSDEDFKQKITELNENPTLRKEDKIDDKESFYKLGEKLYPKEEKVETPIASAPKSSPVATDEDVEETTKDPSDKKFNIKKYLKNGLKSAGGGILVFLNTASLALAGLAVGSGLLMGQSIGLIASMAAPFLVVPALTVAIPLIVKSAKSGRLKKLFSKFSKKSKSKEESKSEIDSLFKVDEKEEAVLPDFPGLEEEFAESLPDFTRPSSESKEDVTEPLPDFSATTSSSESAEPVTVERDEPVTMDRKPPISDEASKDSEELVTSLEIEERKLEGSKEKPRGRLAEIIRSHATWAEELTTTEPVVSSSDTPSRRMGKPNSIQPGPTIYVEPSRQSKHMKKDSSPSKEDLEKRMAELEWRLQMLNSNSILPETGEKVKYVDQMKNNILKQLQECREQYSQYEPVSTRLKAKRDILREKLDSLEKNEKNKNIIDDIELAISQIDRFMDMEQQASLGLIPEEQLREKAGVIYSTVEYVLDEGSRKK